MDGGEQDDVAPPHWGALVQRIRNGDRSAEDAFVAFFEDRLRCILLTRVGAVETARDLAQDTIVRALRGLRAGELHEPATLPLYLHEIALALIAEHGRTEDRIAVLASAIEDGFSAAEHRRSRAALDRLTASDREILWMALVDGFDAAVIAARLGMSEDAVCERKKSALRRIRESLRRRDRS